MSSHFLYEQWLATAKRFATETAIFACAGERAWTFHDLFTEADRDVASDKVVFPHGNGAQFLLSLLRAWRSGSTACPLDGGQSAPVLANLPEACAHVKITSASSGAAKSILFTAEQLAADAANIVSTMGLRPEWPNVACISLAHSYGFSNLVLPLLLHGIPLIVVPTPLPEMMIRASSRAPAISLPGVPALWKAWYESKAIPANTRLAISAGAPLPLQLETGVFENCGVKIHNFYGSSECGGIAYDRTSTPRSNSSLAGSPLENVRLSLSANETLIVESSAVGEMYWPPYAVDTSESALRPGRFETTDFAEIRDNNIYLKGRLTDVLNIAGRKASPEGIEAALRSHPQVIECVVFGIPDSTHDRTEVVVAATQMRSAISVSDLAQFLSQKLPAWQIPRHWWFTEEILPNNRGKVSRAEWKKRFLEIHPRT